MRIRLVKLANLLASENANERAAAALKCTALLRANNASWEEALLNEAPAAESAPEQFTRTWLVCAEQLLADHFVMLKNREVNFVSDIIGRGYALSPRQADWLFALAKRAGIPAWEGADQDVTRPRPQQATQAPPPWATTGGSWVPP